jgi:hypothetical protein
MFYLFHVVFLTIILPIPSTPFSQLHFQQLCIPSLLAFFHRELVPILN